VDSDGSFRYSETVFADISLKPEAVLSIYPNPVILGLNDQITVTHCKAKKESKLELFSITGQILKTIYLVEGASQTAVNIAAFQTGTYILYFNNKGISKSVKFTKY
ncbi:MAG: T9SS type A sorting domain-containing protein, partial [Pedobacter sp.]